METDNVCFWYINLVFGTVALVSSGYHFIQICMTLIKSSFMYVEMWSSPPLFWLSVCQYLDPSAVPSPLTSCCSTLELPYTTKLEVEAAAAAARDEQNKDAVSSASLLADAALRKQIKAKKVKVAPLAVAKSTCIVSVCSLHAACVCHVCVFACDVNYCF